MKPGLSRLRTAHAALLTVLSLAAAGSAVLLSANAEAAPAPASGAGTVLQTNLVSDLPGAAAVTDPNLVNPWGVSASGASPLWISDNNAGVSTLYQVPGASSPVTVNPLVVSIPTPVGATAGTPT